VTNFDTTCEETEIEVMPLWFYHFRYEGQ